MATQLKRHKKKEMLTSALYSGKKKTTQQLTGARSHAHDLNSLVIAFASHPQGDTPTVSVILLAVQVMTNEINSHILFYY